jgi:selenophosphate synthase
VEPQVQWAASVSEDLRWLLCDAMTSGGLLVALPAGSAHDGWVEGAVRIGRVVAGDPGAVRVF